MSEISRALARGDHAEARRLLALEVGEELVDAVLDELQRSERPRATRAEVIEATADELRGDIARIHRSSSLSRRELQVLVAASQGLTAPRTSAALGISLETVKTHRRHVIEKLGGRNMIHAVALAFERGLLRAQAE